MLNVRRAVSVAAVAVTLSTVLCGCSGDDEDEPEPGPANVDVPEGVTLTSGGSTINLGQPASVVYQPDDAGRTVLTVRVEDVTRGTSKDLAGIEDVPEGAVPFYVEASVHNAGPADLGSGPIPLYAVDGSGKSIDATEPTGGGCDPLQLDAAIEKGETAKGCLMFVVPEGSAFGSIQVRTDDLSSPVTWKP